MSIGVTKLDEAKTVNGKPIDIQAEGGSVKINDADVTATDIDATNGVIHVIDKVLMPPHG